MANEELISAIRLALREEGNNIRSNMHEEMVSTRLAVREETNTAVYASEQRMSERFDKIDIHLDKVDGRLDKIDIHLDKVDGRLDKIDGRLDKVDGRLDKIEVRLDKVEGTQKQMLTDVTMLKTNMIEVKGNMVKVISVLDDVTAEIGGIKASQIALETKVEENTASIRRDIQKLSYTVQSISLNVTDAVTGINTRLSMHEDLPIDQAHPNRPDQQRDFPSA